MAIKKFGALILFSDQIEKMVYFYRSLGLNLEEEKHDEEGPLHFACEVGPVHFAIYKSAPGMAPHHRVGGSAILGFEIDNLDSILVSIHKNKFKVLSGPEERPWGKRLVLADPDGRAVEIWGS